MKYGLSHDRGKNVELLELEKLSKDVRNGFEEFGLGYLIGKIEVHPMENGIRFLPSRSDYQKQINLELKTKIFPHFRKKSKHYIFSLHKN